MRGGSVSRSYILQYAGWLQQVDNNEKMSKLAARRARDDRDLDHNYALFSNSKVFSPSQSGLNIDPTIFKFKTNATDRILYFNSDTEGKGTQEAAEGGARDGQDNEVYNTQPITTNDIEFRHEEKKCSRGRISQNRNEIKFDRSEKRYWTEFEEKDLDQFLHYKDFLKLRSKTEMTSEAKKDVESKSRNRFKRIVISQTWVTSWIKDLYEMENQLNNMIHGQ